MPPLGGELPRDGGAAGLSSTAKLPAQLTWEKQASFPCGR